MFQEALSSSNPSQVGVVLDTIPRVVIDTECRFGESFYETGS